MGIELLHRARSLYDKTFPDPHRDNPVTVFEWDGIPITYKNAWYLINNPIIFGNFEVAERAGIMPFDFSSVARVVDRRLLNQVVLHDTPGRGFRGNYWRVIEYDPDRRNLTLRFCGIFGNYDISGVEDIEIPVDYKLFTGFCLHCYQFNEKTVSLEEVNEELDCMGNYPEGLKYIGEVQFRSIQGVPTLVTSDPII